MQVNHIDLSDTLIQRQIDIEHEILSMAVCGKEPKKGHIMEHLSREMFIDKTNIELFDVISDQYQKHGIKRLDPDFLINDYQAKIYKNGVLEALLALNYDYITDCNCDYYIKKLHEYWLNRMAQSCSSLDDYKELEKQKKKYELVTNKTLSNINDLEDLAKMGDDYENRENIVPVKTGFIAIDDKIGHLQGGDMFIIAAATGMGKTCMMLNIALSMAKQGKRILIFSLEMNKQQLLNRIISAETDINSGKYRNNSFTDEEAQKYFGYMYSENIDKLNIQVCTEYNISTARIRSIVLGSNADIIFIDYLGLVSGGNKTNSYERVSEISRELKLLAMEANKPFVVLHQLNRANAERKDKRPILSDLRDSGKIEQDADIIGFVFRPAYYSDSANKNEIQLIIAKNRHGSSNVTARLEYNEHTQRICDRYVSANWKLSKDNRYGD